MGTDGDVAHGLVRIEGYLMWTAEVEAAKGQAVRFSEQLPWLTRAQREDVERIYTAERVAASRLVLSRISDRATALRGEYTARYEQLRRRCVVAAVMSVAAAGGTCAAIGYLSR